MLNRILPRQIDNDYRGHKLALWLFGAVIAVKLAISLGTIFNGHEAASSADGIPLDTFTPAGAQAVVSLFAIWGLAQFVICLLCILALARYRAMIPLLFALLLLEYLGKRVILFFQPVVRTTRFHHQPRAARRDDHRSRAVAAGPSQIGVMP